MQEQQLVSLSAHDAASPSGWMQQRTTGADALRSFSGPPVAYPENGLIHDLFAEQARRTPDRLAAVFDDQQLTYRQLDQRSNQLARELVARGVRPDDRVGLYLERSMQMLIGILATLKAGAAYVPLDPSYPHGHVEFMVHDSAPVVILTKAALIDQLSGLGRTIVALDQELPQPTDSLIVAGLTSRNLAYVVYTSGSTGRPKGVMVEHRSVLRLVINSHVCIGAADGVAHCASPSFDATTWEIWAPLLNGGRVVIIPQHVLLDPRALNRSLVEHRVTVMWLTVGLFNEYVDHLEQAFGGLRYLITGGDVLSPARITSAITKSMPPGQVINAYGPTETTTFATMYDIPGREQWNGQAPPIGRPIANTQVYILDEHHRLLPLGMAGEIYIGGPGVARGYLDQPALTSERFIADPFSGSPGARLYRTGDMGRWLSDGNIDFRGRQDSQVKVRGFRVELGEIEAALQSHPSVQQAVVIAQDAGAGLKRLVGYVELQSPLTQTEPLRTSLLRLRQHLSARLPSYMLPAAIVALDAFPLTANGKIDRRRLPAPDRDSLLEHEYAPAHTDMESRLTRIWQDALRLERIGVHDDFFALGADSICCIRVASEISECFNGPLSSMTLMRHPTIRELSEWIETSAGEPELTGRPANRAMEGGSGKFAPLSIQQQLFLDFSQHYPTWTFWCTTELRLRGALNVDALRKCLAMVVQRHEAFRTKFVTHDGALMQQIDSAGTCCLEVVDFRSLFSTESRGKIQRHINDFLTQYVEPSDGPLLRMQLLKLADQDHVLVAAIHHLVSDGMSFAQFFQELWLCYEATIAGRASTLPRVPMQYSDYCAWQRRQQSASLSKHGQYWHDKFSASTPVRMPTDQQANGTADSGMDEMRINFGKALSGALFALGKDERTMPALVIFSAYSALIAAWCNQRDFVLPLGITGRLQAEHAEVMGFIASGIALRIKLGDEDSFLDLLRSMRLEFMQSYEHLTFGVHNFSVDPELFKATSLSWMGDSAELAGVPAPTYWNERNSHLKVETFRVRSMRTEDGIPANLKFGTQLMWRFQNTPRGIQGHVYYHSDLFTAHYVQTFIRSLRSLCEYVTRDPSAPLSLFRWAQSATSSEPSHFASVARGECLDVECRYGDV